MATRQQSKHAPVSKRSPEEKVIPKNQLRCELEWQRTVSEAQVQALEKTRRDLEDSRNGFAILFEHAPVSYIIMDGAGQIHETNANAVRLLGYDRDKLSRLPFTSLLCAEDVPRFRSHWIHCQKSGEPRRRKLHSCFGQNESEQKQRKISDGS